MITFPPTIGDIAGLIAALPSTGDLKLKWTKTAVLSGWLPCQGGTMGSALSGADFASAAHEALYLHLWNTTTQAELPVIVGRGVSAAADWADNKWIDLPDFRGRVALGYDAANATNRVTGDFGLNAATLGSTGGAQSHTLDVAEIPAHAHSIGAYSTSISGSAGGVSLQGLGESPTATPDSNNAGGGEAHTNLQPGIIAGIMFIKL